MNDYAIAMETESVRSGRSNRSQRDRSEDEERRLHQRGQGHHGSVSSRQSSREREHHKQQYGGSKQGPTNNEMPAAAGVNDEDDDGRRIVNGDSNIAGRGGGGVGGLAGGAGGALGERSGDMELQMNAHDENWEEATTAITGTTSEAGFSIEDVSRLNKILEESVGFKCAKYFGSVVAAAVGIVAFLSPIVMVVLPKIGLLVDWETDACEPDCEGSLIGFTFKLIILLIGSWALFLRKPVATMPRIFLFRAVVLLLVFVLTVAYWLFYGLCILKIRDKNYPGVVSLSVSFVDGLLFIHYLAVVLLEIRHLQPQYVVRVVRSPDGRSRSYTVGQMSLQDLAIWSLQQYYKDFDAYNPYLEHYARRASRVSSFKIYSLDGAGSDSASGRSRAILAAGGGGGRHRDAGHNDRFYEEQEYERRVRKRKARLVAAAEEAFGHVKRLQQDKIGGTVDMGPQDAAQAIFPGLARPLQKYLRVTRQQPRYTLDNILSHLTTCVSHDVSAKAFVDRYVSDGPVIWNDKDYATTQTWRITSTSQLLNSSVHNDTVFRLQQGDVTLLVTVRQMSHFSLTEDVVDQKNKFVLRLSSETSV